MWRKKADLLQGDLTASLSWTGFWRETQAGAEILFLTIKGGGGRGAGEQGPGSKEGGTSMGNGKIEGGKRYTRGGGNRLK